MVFLTALLLASCGGKGPRVKLPAPTPARIGATERGEASWYGHPYHGRRTSNGEVYNMDGLTAAHLSLPFDTLVRVRNLANNRTVDVRINDRGPFVKKRLIDVSREAARRLEMIGPGTTLVEVTVVGTPEMARTLPPQQPPVDSPAPLPEFPAPAGSPCLATGSHAVQVGSFSDVANAEKLAATLRPQYPVSIVSAEANGRMLHRVTVGGALNNAEAQLLLADLRRLHINGFVVRTSEADCAGA